MDAEKPFYDGADKCKRLAELADEANTALSQARNAWRGALEQARRCGAALLEAKRIQGVRHGQWGPWLDKNFNGSRRTAREYARIARRWDDPDVREARLKEMGEISIRKMLEVVSGTPSKKKPVENNPDIWRDILLIHLRQKFYKELAKLSEMEINVALDAFAEGLWPACRTALNIAVCAAGDDPDPGKPPDERAAKLRARLGDALTEKLNRLSTPEIDLLARNIHAQLWDDWYASLKQAMCLVNDCDWYGDSEPTHRGRRVSVEDKRR